MPHLWVPTETEWTTHALSGDAVPLPGPTPAAVTGVMLRNTLAGTPDHGWHLIAPPDLPVRINGEPLSLGIRALCHKDEIRVPGAAAIFFSTEKLVAVEPFTGSPESKCMRCAKPFEKHTPAARCPGCQAIYHQSETRNCFGYGDQPMCVVCGADLVLSSEFSWIPETC